MANHNDKKRGDQVILGLICQTHYNRIFLLSQDTLCGRGSSSTLSQWTLSVTERDYEVNLESEENQIAIT